MPEGLPGVVFDRLIVEENSAVDGSTGRGPRPGDTSDPISTVSAVVALTRDLHRSGLLDRALHIEHTTMW